jgi:ribosomal protein S27E
MTTETDTIPEMPARGFRGLRCLHCNEVDTCVVDLETLLVRCTSCEAEDTPADIKQVLDRWGAVLGWLLMAPLAE